MIRFTRGDILGVDTEALVNSVNCVGIMGRGIALQFKQAFPANFKAYEIACKRGDVQPGRMFVYDSGELTWPRYIINFPTKRHWRGKSRIEDIQTGLKALVSEIRQRGIRSIALPPLGSGLGGLDWNEIRLLIEQALAALPDVEMLVFEPGGGPVDTKVNRSREVTKMTPGCASLVALMRRYLNALMDPSISLLEIHKLMYFLQEAGEPLKLKYVKAPYGPYAENLRHVLHAMEGHLISGYANGGDAPDKQISLVPGADTDAETFLAGHTSTRKHLDRVTELVQGFETPFGLELLATVHWVITRENAEEMEEVASATHAWGDRKRKFLPDQIVVALDRINNSGWAKKN